MLDETYTTFTSATFSNTETRANVCLLEEEGMQNEIDNQGKYNMKAVSTMVRILLGTIRAWERRYRANMREWDKWIEEKTYAK